MSRYSAPKSGSLLNDNSWIRKTDDEDEDIDKDPNYARTVLSHYKSNETLNSPEAQEPKTYKPRTTSVQALTKRFSGSQDELSTVPSSRTTSSYTNSTYSSLKSDSPKTTTSSTVTKDGTTETTITTTPQTLRSPGVISPTQTFTERVKSSSQGSQYSTYTPTRTTKVTETVVSPTKDAEDELYDTLIPSYDSDLSPTDSKTTVSIPETVKVKSSADTDAEDKLSTLIPSIKSDFSKPDRDDVKTTTTTRTSSTAEDELYGTLLPKSITSNLSSPVSSSIKKREIVTVESSRGGESPTLSSPSSTRRTSSYSSYTDDLPSTRTTSYTISTTPSSSYEYSSVQSPTVFTPSTYRSSSRSDDILSDPVYSKSSMTSVYASPERTVLEKDLCSYCRKPFNGDAKMVLDDMRINCHASCFKCEVCNSTLGNMKAGDSLWIYRRMVHCDNCFETTRDKWRR